MAREQINLGQVTEQLKPVAAPIDTYAKPAAPERSPLWDVAQSLGGFERSLDEYVAQTKAKNAETDKLRAIADHYQNNGEGYAQGVANGHIPAWASPAYVESYKAAEGKTSGNQFILSSQAAYMSWDGKNGTDPAAFDAWSQKLIADDVAAKTAGMDPQTRVAFLKGYLPTVQQGLGELQSQFHHDLSANVYKGNIEKHGVISSQMIDMADSDGLTKPEGTDYSGLWDTLTATRDNALKVGAKPDDYDKTLIKTLSEKAIEHREPGLLKLLDKTLPGSTYALSDTAIGASTKLETMHKLETLGRQAQIDAEHRHAKEEKAAKDLAHRTAIDQLAADPSKALPEDLLAAGQKVDPEFRVKVVQWQKTLAEGGVAEDPKAMAGVFAEIFNGGGMASVSKALDNGTIHSAQGLKEATAYAKAVEDGGGPGAKILQGSTVSTTLEAIAKRAPGRDPITDPFGVGGPSDAALVAQTEYKRMLIDWASRNPNASEMEKEKVRADIGQMVLKGISGSFGDGATYRRPADSSLQDAGAAPGVLPDRPPTLTVPGAKPVEAPLPTTKPPQDRTGMAVDPAVEQFKSGFTPIQRSQLEQRAIERGFNPDDVWREVFKQSQQPKPVVPQGMQQQGYQPMSYSPQGSQAQQAPSVTGSLPRVALPAEASSAIDQAATAHGVDAGLLTRYAKIESGGDPSNVTGSYKGLFQLSDGEFRKYGPPGGNIFDPVDNAMAAAAKLRAEAQVFMVKNGRAPTATDLYLVHQQGDAGYAAHMANPNAPAWRNMASTGEGQAKGDAWAKKAVWGNIPDNLKARFPGGVDSVSSADFIDIWRHKVEGTPLPAQTQTATATPEASASWIKRFAGQFGIRL